MLAGYLYSLGSQVRTSGKEGFGDDDGGRAAVGGGTELEFGEWRVDFWRGEDLIEGIDVTELGVGVFGGVEVIDASYFGEIGGCGSVSEARGIALSCCLLGVLLSRDARAYFSIYSLPALPNICAAAGESVRPLVATIISPVVAVGSVRSLKKLPKDPGNIFSNPTTITQSATPCETIFRAICSPVEPVLQLLLTL